MNGDFRKTGVFVSTTLATSLLMLSAFSGSAFAERRVCDDGTFPPCEPGGKGRPDNPGGGGGKPDSPGRGQGDLYADLVVVLRTEEGLPILTQQPLLPEVAGDPLPGGVTYCLQPISSDPVGVNDAINPADGRAVSLIALGGTGIAGEECDVSAGTVGDTSTLWSSLQQEVQFGRLNLGRSPDKVLDQSLAEVTSSLADSSEPIELDEGGRFVWYDEGTGVEVDSPGNNLALTAQLQGEGLPLQDPTQSDIPLPNPANPSDSTGFVDHASAALGAAAGKGDSIGLDLVVYNNRILEIPAAAASSGAVPTLAGSDTVVSDPEFGEVKIGELGRKGPELYIDYTAAGYGYIRSSVYPGCVRGLLADFPTPGLFTPFSGTILNCVFGEISFDGSRGICAGGGDAVIHTAVQAFAQRADDARAVIAFVHDNAVADSTAILPASQAGVDQAGQTDVCQDLGL